MSYGSANFGGIAQQVGQNTKRLQEEKKKKEANSLEAMMPKWSGITNEDGTLKNQYSLQAEAPVTMDQRAIESVRSRALATGDSPWATMARQQQAQNNTDQMAQAQAQSASARNQSMNQLAMRGGVSAGARERLARNSNRDLMMRNQDIAGQNNRANLDIGMQDEKLKMDALTSTMGADRNNAELANQNRTYNTGVNQFNTQNTLLDKNAQRTFDMDIYKQRMALLGANKTADAQAAAGGGGKK